MPKRRLKSTWFNKCIWEAFRIHSWFNISADRENESLYILTVVVFYVFGMMFIKMNKKYTKRIMGYEEIRPFWYFFDLKAYMIMVCMMVEKFNIRLEEEINILWNFRRPFLDLIYYLWQKRTSLPWNCWCFCLFKCGKNWIIIGLWRMS